MDKTDIIDFTELPKEVLDQIPYSIKTKKTKYVVNELPLEIQYLLDKYFNNKLPTITYEDALDFKFDIASIALPPVATIGSQSNTNGFSTLGILKKYSTGSKVSSLRYKPI